jgi:hypothetical protein
MIVFTLDCGAKVVFEHVKFPVDLATVRKLEEGLISVARTVNAMHAMN